MKSASVFAVLIAAVLAVAAPAPVVNPNPVPKVQPVPKTILPFHVEGNWAMDWEGLGYAAVFVPGGFYQAIDDNDGTVWIGNWSVDNTGVLSVTEWPARGGAAIQWDYQLVAAKGFKKNICSACGGFAIGR